MRSGFPDITDKPVKLPTKNGIISYDYNNYFFTFNEECLLSIESVDNILEDRPCSRKDY